MSRHVAVTIVVFCAIAGMVPAQRPDKGTGLPDTLGMPASVKNRCRWIPDECSATTHPPASSTTSMDTFLCWTRTYGGSHGDAGSSVRRTSDGGLVLVGTTWSFHTDTMDIWLLKLDSAGDTSWTRIYGGTARNQSYDVKQTSDSGYVIAGYAAEPSGTQAMLMRVKRNGDLLWKKEYGLGTAYSVQPTADGGFIIGGTDARTSWRGDFWLIKVNAGGDTEWTRSCGDTLEDWGWSVQQATDGGYVLVGQTQSYGAGWWDVMFWKVDSQGNTQRLKTYGGPRYEVVNWDCLERTSDGGYAIVALTGSFGTGGDAWLIRTDCNGDSLWTRLYGGPLNDGGYSVHQTFDGGFIIAGTTGSLVPADSNDLWLVRTDGNGQLLWQGAYGGPGTEEGFCVTQTPDSGFVATGWTTSYGAGGADVYLVKVKEGLTCVQELSSQKTAPSEFVPTVVRGLLVLPASPCPRAFATLALLDLTGRKVLDLKPGANDVSRFAPGVYFLRSTVGGERSAKKIVIQQ